MTDSIREKIYNFIDNNETKIIKYVGLITFIISFGLLWSILMGVGSGYNRKMIPATGLLQTLQAGAAIYTAQQRVKPEIFSDFVIEKGLSVGKQTISLQYINSRIKSVKGLKTKKMVITFIGDNEIPKKPIATYYLNGSDVTADFKDFEY